MNQITTIPAGVFDNLVSLGGLWVARALTLPVAVCIGPSALSLKCVFMCVYVYLKKPVVIHFYHSATRTKYELALNHWFDSSFPLKKTKEHTHWSSYHHHRQVVHWFLPGVLAMRLTIERMCGGVHWGLWSTLLLQSIFTTQPRGRNISAGSQQSHVECSNQSSLEQYRHTLVMAVCLCVCRSSGMAHWRWH